MTAGRSVAAVGALSVLFAAAWLVACASDEETSPASPDTDTPLPGADGGGPDGDGAARDGAQAEPCLPDALCPNGPFDPSIPGGPLDLRTRVNAIRGRGASDVWAVGARGAIAHFDGTTWSRSESGAAESLTGLWLRDSGEVAVATLTAVFGRNVALDGPDGGAPSPGGWMRTKAPQIPPAMAASTAFATSAWAAPGAEWLWGTTIENTAASGGQTQNGLWRARIVPETRSLEIGAVLPPKTCALMGCMQMTGIHGSSADDLWAVGLKGATFHVTGAQSATPSVVAFDSQTWAGLDGVWAASATEAWSAGGAGTLRHYTGGAVSWDVVDVPATEDLHAVWGTSSSDVWAVGDAACVLHYDGAASSRVKVTGLGDRRPDLFTVWSPGPGHLWIGGDGVILSLGGKP